MDIEYISLIYIWFTVKDVVVATSLMTWWFPSACYHPESANVPRNGRGDENICMEEVLGREKGGVWKKVRGLSRGEFYRV
jgi:hypothetical protein